MMLWASALNCDLPFLPLLHLLPLDRLASC